VAAPTDDRQLIDAARSGDRAALDLLLRYHYDRIWALCRRLTGNEADAQDAAQEALIAIARGLHHFDGRAAFTTWSYRVATNACLDELRRRSRRPAPAPPDERSAIDPGPLPDHVVERMDIDRALALLPEEFRAAVVLRDLCDLEYADIGEVLGLAPGTVRSRIARGRAQLARHLGNPEPTTERPTSRP
jgi:RNA polymerase sigma-70 factor (ECF subfamily)